MNNAHRRIVLGSALAAAAIVTNIAPASAMGRSTVSTAPQTPTEVISDRLARAEFAGKQIETTLQSQLETLRQELADLKAQMAIAQGVASAE
jgi:hypothetical protein